MYKLSDKELLCAYEKAKEMELDSEFISIIEQEIERRKQRVYAMAAN